MGRQVKNTSCSWYNICDNNNLMNIWQLNSLIGFTSDRKEFYFSGGDIHSMMNCFGNHVLTLSDMKN